MINIRLVLKMTSHDIRMGSGFKSFGRSVGRGIKAAEEAMVRGVKNHGIGYAAALGAAALIGGPEAVEAAVGAAALGAVASAAQGTYNYIANSNKRKLGD